MDHVCAYNKCDIDTQVFRLSKDPHNVFCSAACLSGFRLKGVFKPKPKVEKKSFLNKGEKR